MIMPREHIYIFNPFIYNIYSRYDENEMINNKPILTHRKFSGTFCDVPYEMIRVEINTAIDELKDIIGSIQPKRIEFENNGEKLIANVYLTNTNKDVQALTILFSIDVYLVIDIYRPDYKKMILSREEEIFNALIFDLSAHTLF